ncbi:MAG: DsrE family protein [Firmicutes bacterium]|nr:DsrE family protein [Bacillota bacterium]
MAKIAFWITAGPDQAPKAMAGLRLAQRLRTVRDQKEVEVYLFGPGVRLTTDPNPGIQEVLQDLKLADVRVGACPANVKQMGLDEEQVMASGAVLRPAGEVLVELVDAGYQIIGV